MHVLNFSPLFFVGTVPPMSHFVAPYFMFPLFFHHWISLCGRSGADPGPGQGGLGPRQKNNTSSLTQHIVKHGASES